MNLTYGFLAILELPRVLYDLKAASDLTAKDPASSSEF
jgi:hypothetical protein